MLTTVWKLNGLPTTRFTKEKLTIWKGRQWLHFFKIFFVGFLHRGEKSFFGYFLSRTWSTLEGQSTWAIVGRVPSSLAKWDQIKVAIVSFCIFGVASDRQLVANKVKKIWLFILSPRYWHNMHQTGTNSTKKTHSCVTRYLLRKTYVSNPKSSSI